jgi:hypothetical protein
MHILEDNFRAEINNTYYLPSLEKSAQFPALGLNPGMKHITHNCGFNACPWPCKYQQIINRLTL